MSKEEELKAALKQIQATGLIRKVRNFLVRLPKEKIKDELNGLDIDSLYMLHQSSLIAEDYEICSVTKELLNVKVYN